MRLEEYADWLENLGVSKHSITELVRIQMSRAIGAQSGQFKTEQLVPGLMEAQFCDTDHLRHLGEAHAAFRADNNYNYDAVLRYAHNMYFILHSPSGGRSYIPDPQSWAKVASLALGGIQAKAETTALCAKQARDMFALGLHLPSASKCRDNAPPRVGWDELADVTEHDGRDVRVQDSAGGRWGALESLPAGALSSLHDQLVNAATVEAPRLVQTLEEAGIQVPGYIHV